MFLRAAHIVLGLALAILIALGPVRADYAAAQQAYAAGNYTEAFRQWRRLADQGEAASQRLVGNMLLSGTGVEVDIDQAFAYFHMAAAQDDVEALITLANLYREGGPVDPDYKQAVDMLYRAADTGHPVAQFDLAEIFFQGEGGVEQAKNHALDWYRLSARSGVLLAQFKLAQALLEGSAAPKDELTGMMWLELAVQTIQSGVSLPISDRVFPFTRIVETDEDRRTLGEIILATRTDYVQKLPEETILEARRRALNYDPAKN